MNKLSIDELLNKGFSLACFILGERADAIRTVEEALNRLEVTMAAQGKRLYYKPASSWTGQDRADRYRNKVLFSELHLLQRLIYITSETYEKQREAGAAGEEEMLISFIKHLVRITTRRNSFYVTLGLSRLLYSYTTAETMEVYNAVIQDPERVKDDYYYRSRKGVLMQELKKRFGSLIEVARGPRGEERFRASEHQGRFAKLVAESLSFFTPWYTPCLVPAGVNPIMDGIAGLSSRGQQEEDKIEVDRIHAVLHPDCYERLVKSLSFDSPEQRLEVPHFFLSSNGDNGEGTSGSDRRHPANLDEDELSDIKSRLDDQSARRKRAFAGGLLRVVVDGTERACLNLAHTSSARFTLEDEAELIEIRAPGHDGELLLASHLLSGREADGKDAAAKASITLEGGQKLTITVAQRADEDGAVVDVAYRETNPLRAATLYARRLVSGGEEPGRTTWTRARVPALALGLALLALCALGIWQVLKNNKSAPSQAPNVTDKRQEEKKNVVDVPVVEDKNKAPQVAQSPASNSMPLIKDEQRQGEGTPPTPRAPERTTPAVAGTNDARRNEQPRQQKREAVANVPDSNDTRAVGQPEQSAPEFDARRSPSNTLPAVPLSEVRKIYVELSGDDAAESVRAKLLESLSASGRFTSAASKDEADALLKVSVKSVDGTKVSASAQLINARGETIWPATAGGKFSGSIEIVAGGIIKELLDEARAR
ncbi:MAG: hypothetical protein H7Y30_08635 [Pyrinomonadaceae bacterium]|nr:hypothetical protein [Pyrinomonadaceae bacterium]